MSLHVSAFQCATPATHIAYCNSWGCQAGEREEFDTNPETSVDPLRHDRIRARRFANGVRILQFAATCLIGALAVASMSWGAVALAKPGTYIGFAVMLFSLGTVIALPDRRVGHSVLVSVVAVDAAAVVFLHAASPDSRYIFAALGVVIGLIGFGALGVFLAVGMTVGLLLTLPMAVQTAPLLPALSAAAAVVCAGLVQGALAAVVRRAQQPEEPRPEYRMPEPDERTPGPMRLPRQSRQRPFAPSVPPRRRGERRRGPAQPAALTPERKPRLLRLWDEEIFSPITVIAGMLEVLSDTATETETRRLTETALTSVQRLEDLCTLLMFDQAIDGIGDLGLLPERILLRDVVESALSALSGRAHQRGIALTPLVDEDFPFVGDPRWLRHMVRELITNAITFTPSGGSAEVRLTATGGSYLISVADTGPGVTVEDMTRATEKHYTGSAARWLETTGLGLGLYSCRLVASAHGGTVALAEGTPSGTVAIVRLPVPVAPLV